MEEENISYAAIQFRTRGAAPQAVKKEEDVVYDEVMGQRKPASEPVNDTEANTQRCQPLACCLGILCVVLLLGIVAVCVYFTSRQTTETDDIHNLSIINNLLLKNENLSRELSDLRVQVTNLTAENIELRALNQNLTTGKQQLETQRSNLTQRIQTMVREWNELNVSRAQWAIDNYCPKKSAGRTCGTCQSGWLNSSSSCYAVNNAKSNNQKTWEGAQEDCREKNSDLAVVANRGDKAFVDENSWNEAGVTGYWIGLRAENGRWKWINGSFLTDSSWVNSAATNNSCVTSFNGRKWTSVNCDGNNAWICSKQGLSV